MPDITSVDPIIEQNYRVAFKQTAKGFWYAEYTVRANDKTELDHRLTECKLLVNMHLSTMNESPKE